ncbi:MAG: hypothetical protein U9M89_00890 [Patescibacteria group bacterium]|nr:hypothetical protein [Patescibacteria group bacterium]
MNLHEGTLQIVRLTPEDARKNTDNYRNFREGIINKSDIYPGVSGWFDRKVTPDISSSNRIGYIGCSEGGLVGATGLVKLSGRRAKICHLSVDKDCQRGRMGEVLFLLMILEASKFAKDIHFTLPANLWGNLSSFFKSFGFDKAQNLGYLYRSSVEELICSQSFLDVRRALQTKIPKIINNLDSDTTLMDRFSALKMIRSLME